MNNGSAKVLFFCLICVVIASCSWWYSRPNLNSGQTQAIFGDYLRNLFKSVYFKIKLDLDANKENVSGRVQRTESSNPNINATTGLILFTTWVDNEEKELVHKNVMNTWQFWKPLVKPLFFYSNLTTGERLKKAGWFTLPVSHTACGKSELPTIKDMFLDAMTNHDSILYGYANGDITFDDGMAKAIRHIAHSDIVRQQPILVLVRRTNVDFFSGPLLNKMSNFTQLVSKGKQMMDGSSDGFFTNKLFPWTSVPDVVIARMGIGMWLVSYARAMNATVIDITKTVRAIHMTTKSGNFESHFKPDSRCNHKLYSELNIAPSSWGCGFITCATREVSVSKHGDVSMGWVHKKRFHKRCFDCDMNLSKILPKTYGYSSKTHFGPKGPKQQ